MFQNLCCAQEDRTTALVDTIPGEFHRKLIGHQGRNIRSISDKFRVDIKVPKSNTDGPITITGRSQGVKKCAEHIQSLAEQHVSNPFTPPPPPPPHRTKILIVPVCAKIYSLSSVLISIMNAHCSVPWHVQQDFFGSARSR